LRASPISRIRSRARPVPPGILASLLQSLGVLLAPVTAATAASGMTALAASVVSAQLPSQTVPGGRAAVEALVFEPLVFEQPEADHHRVGGVPVLMIEDASLPMVTVQAYIRGGYGLFDRAYYGAAMGLPALLRYGGTASRTPAEVDETIEYYAFQVAFGSAGGSVTTSINTLTQHLELALDLWGEMIAEPRFDQGEIDAWRGRQLESVVRRADDPGRLAFSEMNRLLYGDHPVGWQMDSADLAPNRLVPARLETVHGWIVCRDNLTLGVTGDAEWVTIRPLLERFVERLPPCDEELPESPVPDIRRAVGVYLVEKKIDQSVIVMAHPTTVRLADDNTYFSAMIGNSVLGGGGFSSRILGRVRTEEGYAYSATSLWTTPRKHEGIIAAITRTRPDNTVPAIRVILETMGELRDAPPTLEEVSTTVDQIVNGFVFNFDTPRQIVSRTMYYLAQDLPEDWLQRYLEGVQRVTPESIREVFADQLRPEDMTILVVGDPDQIGDHLTALGAVTTIVVR
jgi:zinc protease